MTAADKIRALYGAWELARFRPDGLSQMGRDSVAARQSFVVAWFTLPAALAATTIDWRVAGATPDNLAGALFVEAALQLIVWFGFLLLGHELCRRIDRLDRFPGFVVAYNWAMVIKLSLLLGLLILVDFGLLGDAWLGLLFIGLLVWVAAYETFIFHLTLGLAALPAFGLVMVKFFLGALVESLAQSF